MQSPKERLAKAAILLVLVAVPLAQPALLRAQDPSKSIFKILNVPFSGVEVQAISASSPSNVWTASGNNIGQSAAASLHFNGTSWSEKPLGNTVSGTVLDVTGIAAISPTNIWTVGFNSVSSGPLEVAQQSNGALWKAVNDVQLARHGEIFGEQLAGISAVSADDIFAAGEIYNNDRDEIIPFFEHWNGTAWSQAGPTVSGTFNYITGISALAANDAWAVGYQPTKTDDVPNNGLGHGDTFHFDGTKWTQINSAPNCLCVFTGVTAIAPNDVWAVGYSSTLTAGNFFVSTPMAQHWDGTSWTLATVPSPSPTLNGNQFYGVAAVSSKSVWAVGTYFDDDINVEAFIGFAEHWDGSSWSLVTIPACPNANCVLTAIAALPTGEVWLGGESADAPAPGNVESPLILFTEHGK
jgi:hypothetical protein